MTQVLRRYDGNDLLAIERARHNETRRELQETKELLGQAHGRLLNSAQTGRLPSSAVESILDVAIENGQISDDGRDDWRRKFDASPSEAVVELARIPRGAAITTRTFGEAEDAAYRREAAARLGVAADEVL